MGLNKRISFWKAGHIQLASTRKERALLRKAFSGEALGRVVL
jgi:hypothetical protein